MSIATIETREVVEDLLSAGFTDMQAEAVARSLPKVQLLDHSMLATKAEVEALRAESRLATVAFWKFMCTVAYILQTLIIVGVLIKVVKP